MRACRFILACLIPMTLLSAGCLVRHKMFFSRTQEAPPIHPLKAGEVRVLENAKGLEDSYELMGYIFTYDKVPPWHLGSWHQELQVMASQLGADTVLVKNMPVTLEESKRNKRHSPEDYRKCTVLALRLAERPSTNGYFGVSCGDKSASVTGGMRTEEVRDLKDRYTNARDKKTKKKIARELIRAARQGNAEAASWYGRWLEQVADLKKPQEALDWYLKAFRWGDPKGALFIAEYFRNHMGFVVDPRESLEWYKLAAEKGDPRSNYRMGEIYFQGEVVPRNPVKAIDCFLKAARGGLPAAQLFLGHLYCAGRDVDLDYRRGLEWLWKAHEGGEDQTIGPIVHYLGRLGQKDPLLKLYREKIATAAQGDRLGDWYLQGVVYWEVAPRDLPKGFEWLKKCAEKGDANAQKFVADCYEKGRGVERDLGKAREWMERAAQGDKKLLREVERIKRLEINQ